MSDDYRPNQLVITYDLKNATLLDAEKAALELKRGFIEMGCDMDLIDIDLYLVKREWGL